jgi:hypothetical protein
MISSLQEFRGWDNSISKFAESGQKPVRDSSAVTVIGEQLGFADGFLDGYGSSVAGLSTVSISLVGSIVTICFDAIFPGFQGNGRNKSARVGDGPRLSRLAVCGKTRLFAEISLGWLSRYQ